MPQTPRLALPLLAAGQSQKDVTHNEALLALDRMVALAVVSRSQAAPPALPVLGDLFIVPAAGAVVWGHPADQLLQWVGSGWQPQQPRPGQLALVLDENRLLIFSNGWQDRLPVAGLQLAGRAVLAAPQGGTTIDTQARAALLALLTTLRDQGVLLP